MIKTNLYQFKKSKLFEYIFIFTMAIAFLSRIGKYDEINYFVSIGIASIWTTLYLVDVYLDNKTNFKISRICQIEDSDLYVLLPILLLCAYNLALLFTGKLEIEFIGRCISNLYMMFITVTSALAGIHFFKNKTMTLIFKSVILNFLFIIILNFFLYGFDCFKQLYLSMTGNVNAINPFEVHDLTFAAGILLIIVCINFRKIDNKMRYLYLFSTILIIVLGFKRIQFLTLFICSFAILCIFFVKKWKKSVFKFCMISSVAIILFSFLYIWIIDSELLLKLCNALNIETMGRLTLYDWVSQYYSFSPFFFGIGSGTTFKLLETTTTWGIAALHSDILRMFVETGFIMFTLWLVYYLIFLLNYIFKKTGKKTGILYFLITLYMFIIYFTDNTLLYYSTQFIYVSCIILCIKFKGINLNL